MNWGYIVSCTVSQSRGTPGLCNHSNTGIERSEVKYMSAGASLVGDPKSASLLHHAYDKAARVM
jgi:hypothetical protein